MIAIILAAGTGTRLMPLTKEIPKPLLEIGNMTILERMMIASIVRNADHCFPGMATCLSELFEKFYTRSPCPPPFQIGPTV